MSRRVVVNGLLGGAMGFALGALGHSWTTPGYWVVFAIFLGAIANSLWKPNHE